MIVLEYYKHIHDSVFLDVEVTTLYYNTLLQ